MENLFKKIHKYRWIIFGLVMMTVTITIYFNFIATYKPGYWNVVDLIIIPLLTVLLLFYDRNKKNTIVLRSNCFSWTCISLVWIENQRYI